MITIEPGWARCLKQHESTWQSSVKNLKTQADFTYSILGNVISIIDLDLGNRSVTNGGRPVCGVVEYDRRANKCFLKNGM
jgi:hypothetical protein